MSYHLISAEELSLSYQKQHVVVVDCRFSLADTGQGESLYKEAHIDGAYYLHLDRDMSGPKGKHGGRHPLPDPETFVECLRAIGVNHDSLVVAYDDSRFAFASRLWWLLRYIGHNNVKLLDGGLASWQKAGFSLSHSAQDSAKKGNIVADVQQQMIVDINVVKTIPLLDNATLIDSREEERFLGLKEPVDPIAGHINGAVNYPWQQVSDEQGKFSDLHCQRQRWGSVIDDEELVVYCGSGVTACVNLLSLAEIGRDDAKLYPGSWSDWCSYL